MGNDLNNQIEENTIKTNIINDKLTHLNNDIIELKKHINDIRQNLIINDKNIIYTQYYKTKTCEYTNYIDTNIIDLIITSFN